MRMKKAGRVLAAVMALGTASVGVAWAQAEPAEPPAAPVDVPAQREVNLTPEQQVAKASEYLAEMGKGAEKVRGQLKRARAARDVVKVLCLNDKLNQIDVAIRSAEDRQAALGNAVKAQNTDQARHEFTVLQVLRDRVRSLVAEANQCIGEETGIPGESKVTVEIDPNLPDDPSTFPDDPIESVPPVITSPTE